LQSRNSAWVSRGAISEEMHAAPGVLRAAFAMRYSLPFSGTGMRMWTSRASDGKSIRYLGSVCEIRSTFPQNDIRGQDPRCEHGIRSLSVAVVPGIRKKYPEEVSGVDIRGKYPEEVSGVGIREKYPEEVSGVDIREKYQEEVSRVDIREKYPEEVSGVDFREKYPEEVSGVDIRNKYPEAVSGVDFREKYPVTVSRIGIRDRLPGFIFGDGYSRLTPGIWLGICHPKCDMLPRIGK
jgi:hypothetical protein